MFHIPRRLAAVGVAIAVVFGIALVAPASPASAGTGLYYTVVDSDNDPYSGIYLRDGTSMSNVRRTADRYMLYGTTVELNCYAWGEAVGPYANRIWHHVRVASGANTNQQGWIADRYLNTPIKANQPLSNWPQCGAPPPPPPPTYDGSVYFTSERNEWSPATVHRPYSSWTASSCSSVNANNFPSWIQSTNKYVTTAAGWSIGRLGPVYMLEQTQGNPGGGRWQEIDYILLFDPGNHDDFFYTGSCDTKDNRGALFTKWLKANPNAKLVILAGARTGQDNHRGIQELYFNYLRNNGGPRDRVLVCNYDGFSHDTMYADFMHDMNRPPALPLDHNDCPATESWAWHP